MEPQMFAGKWQFFVGGVQPAILAGRVFDGIELRVFP
jgi:hypothetical protein